jgi:hypothetical protein
MQKDAWKVAIGVAVFLGFFTFPIWYNVAFGHQDWEQPVIADAAGNECVMSRAQIRLDHMTLLDQWRNEVVRDELRFRPGVEGDLRTKSITRTCMGCHTDRNEFCGRCHQFVGVEGQVFSEVFCWDCHVDTVEVARRDEP